MFIPGELLPKRADDGGNGGIKGGGGVANTAGYALSDSVLCHSEETSLVCRKVLDCRLTVMTTFRKIFCWM